MNAHSGSCHCGAVRFRITAPITELTTCDCSLCVKKNALMTKVHESELEILAGQEALRSYRWNTHRAQHFFCGECGIYTFHRKRAAPDHYGVNIFCLDGFDHSAIPVRATEGIGMTVTDPSPREEWPGPRQASHQVDEKPV